MFAFCCVSDDHDLFHKRAAHAIQAAIEGNSLLMRRHRPPSLTVAINEMLLEAAEHGDLEGIVLIDQGAGIDAPDFLQRVRWLLDEHRSTAIFGAHAARESAEPPPAGVTPPAAVTEVDAVDGSLLVLSPWATRELRLDPGSDLSLDECAVDLCRQVRDAQRRVAVVDFGSACDADADAFNGIL